ncbi:hypothetical protein ACIA8G_37005 [Lentzea sp. NPDC051213]|uniref:hypothetical protein n=1 Tax=Lentzea sp. NPDC051213 TaxID=3364126 RepID=UPI0037A4EB07
MGASGWIYYAEYSRNFDDVLNSLHDRVLASGDFLWTDDDLPRPRSLQELRDLYEDEDYEHLAEEGTHSVLDIERLAVAVPDQPGVVVVMHPAKVHEVFGTYEPTREQFDAAYKGTALHDFPTWSGRITTLYADGRPAEIVVWGHSGD